MAYNITSPARRRNISKVMAVLKEQPPVNDDMILTAHASGMEAREDGAALADNPYVPHVLREAWLEGWYAGAK